MIGHINRFKIGDKVKILQKGSYFGLSRVIVDIIFDLHNPNGLYDLGAGLRFRDYELEAA